MRINDKKVSINSTGACDTDGRGGAFLKRRVFTVKYSDLDAAATTDTVTADDIPADSLILGISHKLKEVFAGGSVSACTVDLGDGSNADRFVDAKNVFTGATLGFNKEGVDNFGEAATDTGGLPLQVTTAFTPTVTVTTTDDNVDQLTSGEIEFYITYFTETDPETVA